MADDDEIDILGDYSFNSCLAQNNQGIPSCSSREDTVHPQWLLDSMSANWYDQRDGPSRRLTGTGKERHLQPKQTVWSEDERRLLVREMKKYGRNVRKISQTIKSKTEAEIQALIEAEFGVQLDTPSFGLERHEDTDEIPSVAQEEIVTEETANVSDVLSTVTTASPTVPQIEKIKLFHKNIFNKKNNKESLLKFNILNSEDKLAAKTHLIIDPSQILYEDDLMIGSTESVGSDLDPVDSIVQKMAKQQRAKVRKLGNHRRKVSRNFDGPKRNKSKELLKSPGRQRKDSSVSDDSTKSPKMEIVLGSGQALLLSEGEQVIKIAKKQESESESDIEIDVDSESEGLKPSETDTLLAKVPQEVEPPIAAVPLTNFEPVPRPSTNFEPMPRRQKKINMDGDGGLTIMHTSSGDLFSRGAEPKKERVHKPRPVPLLHCKHYSKNMPAPFEVHMYVSALVRMDGHAHTSRAEVMGLVGGKWAAGGRVALTAYRAASAKASGTHCDMDPVSQASAAEHLSSLGLSVCAWHHSHPQFPPEPSALDLLTQRALQRALERDQRPLLGIITSQHWPPGRTASQYRCIRIENPEDDSEIPTGYQFSVKLVPDLTADSLQPFLCELHTLLRDSGGSEYSVRMDKDQCPQAGCTYLDKYLSSVTHHMRSAGYRDDEPITERLLRGIRDVFR